ncbi:MAG: hypothetical protein L0Y56_12935 [Nitrospira sp.]|nr:hypothetical protein [Nitrospira sp.]
MNSKERPVLEVDRLQFPPPDNTPPFVSSFVVDRRSNEWRNEGPLLQAGIIAKERGDFIEWEKCNVKILYGKLFGYDLPPLGNGEGIDEKPKVTKDETSRTKAPSPTTDKLRDRLEKDLWEEHGIAYAPFFVAFSDLRFDGGRDRALQAISACLEELTKKSSLASTEGKIKAHAFTGELKHIAANLEKGDVPKAQKEALRVWKSFLE